MKNLILILTEQTGSHATALEILEEMQERVLQGDEPSDVLLEHGIDADYVFDLLTY